MGQMTPLVQTVARQAKKYTARSRVNHEQHGDWLNSYASDDTAMTTWTTALGCIVQAERGEAPDESTAWATGAAFLRANWEQIGRPV